MTLYTLRHKRRALGFQLNAAIMPYHRDTIKREIAAYDAEIKTLEEELTHG